MESILKAVRDSIGALIPGKATLSEIGGGWRLSVVPPGQRSQVRWNVVYRKRIGTKDVGQLVAQLQREESRSIIVTDYVPLALAKQLRQWEQPFLDAAGNGFLSEKGLHVYVAGNARQAPARPLHKSRRRFRPTELKLIFLLLHDQNTVMSTYRDLADRVDISLGNVSETFDVLHEYGYLYRPSSRSRSLINVQRLLEQWVRDYLERLRPSLVSGRFKGPNQDWFADNAGDVTPGVWGGEVAVAKYTNMLRPATATIYFRDKPAPIILANRLHRSDTGDTELVKQFWPDDVNDDSGLAPAIVVYADLLAIDDPRAIEVANILYETHIAPSLETT